MPSTSTFTVPSGKRINCRIVAIVPILKGRLHRAHHLRRFLRNKQYLLVISHRHLKRFNRFRPPHKERLDDLGIDNDVSEGSKGY